MTVRPWVRVSRFPVGSSARMMEGWFTIALEMATLTPGEFVWLMVHPLKRPYEEPAWHVPHVLYDASPSIESAVVRAEGADFREKVECLYLDLDKYRITCYTDDENASRQ